MEASGAQRPFAPPPLPAHHVSRARLLDQLESGWDAPITLVAAGAGAGKTVLLAEWIRRSQARTAWLSLAPADDDPVRFWRRFTAALRSVGVARTEMSAALPAEVGALLRKGHTGSAEPACVVLDDAHVLRNPRIRAGLDGVVRAGPSPLRLVLAARSDPLLPLPRYRLAGTIREIRGGQLIMTAPEAAGCSGTTSRSRRPLSRLCWAHGGMDSRVGALALRMEGVSRRASSLLRWHGLRQHR
jgi:LuxR family maltose regulon positive regulatory protein